MQEGLEPLPLFDQCGVHIPSSRLLSIGIRISATRRRGDDSGGETWRWKRDVAICNSVWRGKRETRWWRVWKILSTYGEP